MASRQTQFTAYTGLYVAIVIAVLVVVNILADKNNKSYDSTANKKYSLSDQTEKVVKGLKGDFRAVYFDRTSRFESAKGLLDRYANISTSFKIEYVDPDKDPAKAKAMGARSYGTLILDTTTNASVAPHDPVTDSFHAINGNLVIGNTSATSTAAVGVTEALAVSPWSEPRA